MNKWLYVNFNVVFSWWCARSAYHSFVFYVIVLSWIWFMLNDIISSSQCDQNDVKEKSVSSDLSVTLAFLSDLCTLTCWFVSKKLDAPSSPYNNVYETLHIPYSLLNICHIMAWKFIDSINCGIWCFKLLLNGKFKVNHFVEELYRTMNIECLNDRNVRIVNMSNVFTSYDIYISENFTFDIFTKCNDCQ